MDNRDLERRVIVLEEQSRHERELTDWRFSDLSRRLQAMERGQARQLPTGSMSKIMIAVALPLAVLVITGDLRRALLAALRLAMGG